MKNFVEQLKDFQNKAEEAKQNKLVEKSKILNGKSLSDGASFLKEKKQGKMKVIPGGK